MIFAPSPPNPLSHTYTTENRQATVSETTCLAQGPSRLSNLSWVFRFALVSPVPLYLYDYTGMTTASN